MKRKDNDTTTGDDRRDTMPGHRPWEEIARPGLPHPLWWHPLNLTTWTGVAGVGLDALHLAPVTLLGVGGVATVVGMGIGSACVHAPDETTASYVYTGGILGAATGAGMGAWAWVANATGLFTDLWQPGPWLGLAAGGALFATAYTTLRLRLAAARTPHSPLRKKRQLRASGHTWARIMAEAGFGHVTVADHYENWSGYRVLIELDPDRDDSTAQVVNATEKITTVAARVLAQDTITLRPDALTIQRTDNARIVSITVRLREVLTSTIDPPTTTDPITDVAAAVEIGLWEDGEKIEAGESGPGGVAVGAAGSGKSTYEHGLTAQWSRRPHVLNWAAGLSKFEAFIEPWITPVLDGRASRPVYDMIGGGSRAGAAEFWSAASVLAAAHTLMTHRMSSPGTPRKGGNLVVSPDHPRVVVQLDEVDVLTKYRLPTKNGELVRPQVELPGGRRLTVWEMMVDIGSKGRSEGVELEIASQRITDEFWGVAVRSLLTNVQRRAAFYTTSSIDADYLLKGTRLDATTLRNNAMYLALKGDAKATAGKAAYYTEDTIRDYAIRADQTDTIGRLSGTEATALGDLYTQRWNPERITSILDYFGGQIGDLATHPTTTGATTEPTPTAGGTSGEAAPAAGETTGSLPVHPGRQALRDAINRSRQHADNNQPEAPESPEAADVDRMWTQVHAFLNDQTPGGGGLPGDSLGPVPPLLAHAYQIVAAEPGQRIATATLAARLSTTKPDTYPPDTTDAKTLGSSLTAILTEVGVERPSKGQFRLGDKVVQGYRLAELAEAIHRYRTR